MENARGPTTSLHVPSHYVQVPTGVLMQYGVPSTQYVSVLRPYSVLTGDATRPRTWSLPYRVPKQRRSTNMKRPNLEVDVGEREDSLPRVDGSPASMDGKNYSEERLWGSELT